MKSLEIKGVKELMSYRKRLTRLHGMGRISAEDFKKAYDRVNELIDITKEIEEE